MTEHLKPVDDPPPRLQALEAHEGEDRRGVVLLEDGTWRAYLKVEARPPRRRWRSLFHVGDETHLWVCAHEHHTRQLAEDCLEELRDIDPARWVAGTVGLPDD